MVYAERQELLYWIKQVACQIHYSFTSKCPVADVGKKKNKGTSVLLFFNPKAFSTALLCFLYILSLVIVSFKGWNDCFHFVY